MGNKKKKNNKSLYVFICLLLIIGIGFAYLTESLSIRGLSNLGHHSWNIYFDNIYEVEGEDLVVVAPETNGTSTTELNFSVNLDKPGDKYVFDVEVVNGGTLDAMIGSINITGLTEEQKQYAYYNITYLGGEEFKHGDLLSADTADTITVEVGYKMDVSESLIEATKSSININFSMSYFQADKNAKWRNVFVHKNGDGSHIGDEVCFKSECFLVVNNDGENAYLLAKYPLYEGMMIVAPNAEYVIDSYMIDTNSRLYGLQNSEFPYYDEDNNQVFFAGVPFSSNSYWFDNYVSGNKTLTKLKSQYGDIINFGRANVYDKTRNGSPSFYGQYATNGDYSIAYYVEEYAERLRTMGLDVVDSRLLTYAEGASLYYLGFPVVEGIENAFWLGSPHYDYKNVIMLSNDTYRTYDSYALNRPVIVVPSHYVFDGEGEELVISDSVPTWN